MDYYYSNQSKYNHYDHPDLTIQGPKEVNFSPYAENGGSVVAVAGDNYAVIGADTRLSSGFSIYTREQSKLFKLSDTTVLGATGCWCDTLTLTRLIRARMLMYTHEHGKDLKTPAIAQMLSTMLYNKRFFPFYVSNVLAGIDNDGKGCVYSYDPIGHLERSNCRAGGSAGALLQPLLDNQIDLNNMQNMEKVPLSRERGIALVKDVFICAAERDIHTGDSIIINVITTDGTQEEFFQLRKD